MIHMLVDIQISFDTSERALTDIFLRNYVERLLRNNLGALLAPEDVRIAITTDGINALYEESEVRRG